ncbi:WD40 repeat-like protein [Auriculariales sp. MPI-PUGE-AT-0066]|nr:WD40 repeat-like protein [Auriculariales sp. MPI-PUGE-AT-0066]
MRKGGRSLSRGERSRERRGLHKLLNSVLGSGSSSESSSPDTEHGFPWQRSRTRPPSPALSDNYSLLVGPSGEDDEALRTHSELYERMRVMRMANDVPSRTPLQPQRTPNRSPKHILPRLLSFGSIRAKRRSKRKAAVDEFGNLLPLGGEEGELVDDEACFVEEVQPVLGLDIISLLPVEISLYTLLFLEFTDLLKCQLVCRYWQQLANDNLIWRDLFYRNLGWRINRAVAGEQLAALNSPTVPTYPGLSALPRARSCDSFAQLPSLSSPRLRPPRVSIVHPSRRTSVLFEPSAPAPVRAPRTLAMDWMSLYKARLNLQRNWQSGQPQVGKISGHDDSVYCIEFDQDKIVTGSRDRTIKVWSLRTFRLRQTLVGHEGSVLCLKFERSGFMVSGSSDRKIIVWDLNRGTRTTTLTGHSGGVLDIRIDKNWIVSCSKDAQIRVWSRRTLELHCTLHGHDGPVNAVGLQNGRIVSASGDGNMILWDIAKQARIRTFAGHERGLACIEFHGDIIVSGANDAMIKVWSAVTGECLQTLSGHDMLVRALAYDPPSGRLVSASYDMTIKVWDLHKGKLIRDFKDVYTSHIFDVKFDASRIIGASSVDKVKVLDFSPGVDTSVFL